MSTSNAEKLSALRRHTMDRAIVQMDTYRNGTVLDLPAVRKLPNRSYVVSGYMEFYRVERGKDQRGKLHTWLVRIWPNGQDGLPVDTREYWHWPKTSFWALPSREPIDRYCTCYRRAVALLKRQNDLYRKEFSK